MALKADRAYSILTISSPELQKGEHYVYEGGEIEGENENGVYTQITAYTGGTIKEYNQPSNMMRAGDFRRIEENQIKEKSYDKYIYMIIGLVIALAILGTIAIILVKTGKINIKGSFILLLIGILIGAIITTVVFYVLDKHEENIHIEQNEGNGQERPEMLSQGIEEEGGKGEPAGQERQGNPNQGERLPAKPQ